MGLAIEEGRLVGMAQSAAPAAARAAARAAPCVPPYGWRAVLARVWALRALGCRRQLRTPL